jgi:serine/threonine protein phosphatase PrpC
MSLLKKKKPEDDFKKPTFKLSTENLEEIVKGNHITFVGATDVGKHRSHNEDNHLLMNLTSASTYREQTLLLASTDNKGALLMVTDGMGGAAAGDVASRIVKETLENWFRDNWCKNSLLTEDFPLILQNSVKEANKKVYKLAQKNHKYSGMGATITVAGIIDNMLYMAQVGDSRGYLKRNGKFIQITKDQSLVNKLVESGNLTKEEARKHLAKNVILQAIGVSERLEMGFYTLPLKSDDLLLLCSDGLSDMLSDTEISEILDTKNDLLSVTRNLIKAANNAGGKDNITVVLSKFSRKPGEKDVPEIAQTRKVDLEDLTEVSTEKTSRYTIPPDENES